MLKRPAFVIAIPLVLLFVVKLLTVNYTATPIDSESPQAPAHTYRIYSLEIPANIEFAGEKVPAENFEVKERFDRELLVNSYWQSQTVLLFKRANRWFPEIEKILKEEGIPEDFKYLALIESGLMNAVSPAGAAGFWQILQSTGGELGLEINNNVDERYHVEKSTRAAARHLKGSYDLFKNWTLAAAAYNMGRTGVLRQLKEQQVNDYYNLWLNDETSRYVFRILATKAIFENPLNYGFVINNEDLYQPIDYYTVKVDSTITDMPSFARMHHITYKELRILNPWIRSASLSNPTGKEYEIKITRETLFELVVEDQSGE